jgi:hypothetical protein
VKRDADLRRAALEVSAASVTLGCRLAVAGNLPLAYAVLAIGTGALSLPVMQPATTRLRRRGGSGGRS